VLNCNSKLKFECMIKKKSVPSILEKSGTALVMQSRKHFSPTQSNISHKSFVDQRRPRGTLDPFCTIIHHVRRAASQSEGGEQKTWRGSPCQYLSRRGPTRCLEDELRAYGHYQDARRWRWLNQTDQRRCCTAEGNADPKSNRVRQLNHLQRIAR
jgi:hypothetical protein